MTGAIEGRVVGRLFRAFVVGWVVLLAVGLVWGLPYVGRGYAGITLPLYGGFMLLTLGVASLWTGMLWRGRHPPLERGAAPPVYWGIVVLMLVAAAVLLAMGTYHLLHRP
jgi:hypothetical protein